MAEMPSTARWQELGPELTRCREALAPRYANLELFARERGINRRVAWDIENARRTNYRRQTLREVEAAYGLPTHWIERFLAGEAPPSGAMTEPAPPLHYDDPRIQSVVDATPELDYADRRALAEFTRILIERADAIRRDLSA